MITEKHTYTYADYAKLPEGAPYQLIGGNKIEGAPDIVAEVLTPSTAYYDLRHKRVEYRKAGVREYWIVDPIESSIEIYENTGDDFVLYSSARGKGTVRSKLYPEIEVAAEDFFRE